MDAAPLMDAARTRTSVPREGTIGQASPVEVQRWHQFLLQWQKTDWPRCIPASTTWMPGLNAGEMGERTTRVPPSSPHSIIPRRSDHLPPARGTVSQLSAPGLPTGVRTGRPFVCQPPGHPFPRAGFQRSWHSSPAFQHLPSHCHKGQPCP